MWINKVAHGCLFLCTHTVIFFVFLGSQRTSKQTSNNHIANICIHKVLIKMQSHCPKFAYTKTDFYTNEIFCYIAHIRGVSETKFDSRKAISHESTLWRCDKMSTPVARPSSFPSLSFMQMIFSRQQFLAWHIKPSQKCCVVESPDQHGARLLANFIRILLA